MISRLLLFMNSRGKLSGIPLDEKTTLVGNCGELYLVGNATPCNHYTARRGGRMGVDLSSRA